MKPANILLKYSKDNQLQVVKLTDFDTIREVEDDENDEYTVVGTPGYMDPDVKKGFYSPLSTDGITFQKASILFSNLKFNLVYSFGMTVGRLAGVSEMDLTEVLKKCLQVPQYRPSIDQLVKFFSDGVSLSPVS